MNYVIHWHDLGRALALLVIFEGILPFLNPESAKAMFRKVAEWDAKQLRIMGLVSMLGGCWILFRLH